MQLATCFAGRFIGVKRGVNMDRILIVEDDSSLCQVFQIYFEKKGYLVSCTPTYEHAVKWLEGADKPDLVIADIGLPDKDGLQLCRKIKTDMNTRHLPVIILTGRADNASRVRAGMESYANLYLNKPIEFDDLYQAVQGLIKKYKEEQSVLKNIYTKKFSSPGK